eukprot:CAMPEP_0170194722 /NCGR_PEP_ID=MMETSP0040_2-20121228/59879_1 /TAXON_ID=641309 /ORGANISM="Lotharella oceanica, Strain CCMP622" /LENGTH=147 /DNA_ID=CAMNT_0010443697 /DNA_START=50 /DNA_END=492 /DNA_ORIENTATION=+
MPTPTTNWPAGFRVRVAGEGLHAAIRVVPPEPTDRRDPPCGGVAHVPGGAEHQDWPIPPPVVVVGLAQEHGIPFAGLIDVPPPTTSRAEAKQASPAIQSIMEVMRECVEREGAVLYTGDGCGLHKMKSLWFTALACGSLRSGGSLVK